MNRRVFKPNFSKQSFGGDPTMRRWIEDWIVVLTSPPLVKAAKKGDCAAMQKLLDGGASVDISDRYGRTALMEACRRGDNEAVNMLLDHGADPYKQSTSDKDAFRYALTRQVLETLSMHAAARKQKQSE
jgi:ankyrin repeat protein